MDRKSQVWADKTNAIWVGVLLYAIGGLVYGMVAGMQSLGNAANDIVSFTNSGSVTVGSKGLWPFFRYLLLATTIVGYALYIIGLKSFRDILEDNDSQSVVKVRTGAIIALISYVWLLIGFWGWFATILIVISFIFMLMGFIALKNSCTFPAKARKGASNLFISTILGLIAGILYLSLGRIPLVGYVIGAMAGVIVLVSYILIFVGWGQIKNADPNVLE